MMVSSKFAQNAIGPLPRFASASVRDTNASYSGSGSSNDKRSLVDSAPNQEQGRTESAQPIRGTSYAVRTPVKFELLQHLYES